MITMMSTKLTKGGQTIAPKEVRTALDIADGTHVYWSFDGRRVWVSAAPADLLEVTGEEDFRPPAEVEGARLRDAWALPVKLRARYGLA